MKAQTGVVLVLVLLVLGVGAIILVPTLNYASSALRLNTVSRESTEVQYALDAITQQALWMMEYYGDTNPTFQCDPAPAPTTSFSDCVASKGAWYLTTPPLATATPRSYYTIVDQVNDQDVTVSVEVPGTLDAPPYPTPTPNNAQCFDAVVSRDADPSTPGDQTWVQVGEPITYNFHIWNCGNKNISLRRIKALLAPSFSYNAGSTTFSSPYETAPSDLDPETEVCDGVGDYYPCPQTIPTPITDGSLLVNWPSGTNNYVGGDDISFTGGQWVDWTFNATPSTWGVFYVEAILCYFASPSGDPGPCQGDDTNTKRTGKVAPVAVGMFNIQGRGKGHAYGASSRLDEVGSSDLISQQPQ